MKSPIEKALDKIGSINIQKLEEPKKEKANGKNDFIVYDPRPTIYLSDKDMPTAAKYKAGDKVIIIAECTVVSTNTHDRIEGKETKKSFNTDLRVDAIADITKG
jgi:hypothetical protein